MSLSKQVALVRQRLISRLFPEISEVTAETMEILLDIEQVTDILASFEEARRGQVVALTSAFSDL